MKAIGLSRREWLLAAPAMAASVAGVALPVAAAEGRWPTRPLRLLVGFPGGSSPDLMARLLADPLSRALGQPVVVDNRVGAGGNLAATLVARATDGHTLGLMINGNLTTARLLQPATAYDPATDLAPVALLGSAPLLLCAGAQAPTPFKAFAPHAREAGARWNFGSPGIGTLGHLGMELLQQRTGLAAVHVPYPGNPQVVAALLAGEVQMALLPPGLALPLVRAGRLQVLLATSTGRSGLAPEVPGLAESGIDLPSLEIWNAVAAPRRQPGAQVQRLATELNRLVREPAVRDAMAQQGWSVVGAGPEGLARRMAADTALMAPLIRRLQPLALR
ncbi:Bug family tripartite tricarboxylate transporter substrate binding protein [Hydrogenophaga sp. R2]|uniref:Bug family tripartite tricarboxylate transporter substrate binding protein n=1 Tax=Hydrogenophaga sp. R2 TaxID=3132827 RepID=UPI003CEF3D36